MMDEEDLRPRSTERALKNLDELSIESLHEYIGELEREIERVKRAIDVKECARAGADTFFSR